MFGVGVRRHMLIFSDCRVKNASAIALCVRKHYFRDRVLGWNGRRETHNLQAVTTIKSIFLPVFILDNVTEVLKKRITMDQINSLA